MPGSSTVVFALDEHQVQSLEDSPVPGDAVILTGSFVRLAMGDARYVNLWKFISPEKVKSIHEQAWSACEEAREELRHKVQLGSCDVFSEMAYEPLYPLRFSMFSWHVIQSALDELKPEQVFSFGEMGDRFYYDPAVRPSDLFNALAAIAVESRGLKHAQLYLSDEVKATYSQFHSIQKPPVNPRTMLPGLPKASRGMSIAIGSEYVEQEGWTNRHDGAADGWVVASNDYWYRHGNHPFIDFDSIQHLPFQLGDVARSVAREFKVEAYIRETMDPGYGAAMRDPRVAYVWEGFAWDTAEAARSYYLGRFLGEAVASPVSLIGDDSRGQKRCLAWGLRDAGTPTLSLRHSGLGLIEGRTRHKHVFGDLAVWGESDRAIIQNLRDESSNVHAVGSLIRSSREFRSPALADAGPFRIILATTAVTDPAYAHADLVKHLETWRDIRALAAGHPDWEFVIKSHPRYDYNSFYNHLDEQHDNIRLFEEGDLRAEDKRVVGVLVNYPTSYTLDLVEHGIPVFYLKHAPYPWSMSDLESEGFPVMSTVAALEKELAHLDGPKGRHLLDEQVRACQNMLGAILPESADLLGRALDDLKQQAGGQGNSSAAYLLDLIMAVDYLGQGLMDKNEFLARLSELKARRSKVRGVPHGLKQDALGTSCMEYFLKKYGEKKLSLEKPMLVWAIYRAVPRSWRNGLASIRQLASQACIQEARHLEFEGVHARWLVFLTHVLAPGRWLRSIREKRAAQSG